MVTLKKKKLTYREKKKTLYVNMQEKAYEYLIFSV